MLNNMRQCFKIRVVLHLLFLWNKVGDPQFFFAFLTQVIHYLTAVKILKNVSTGKFSHKPCAMRMWHIKLQNDAL